MAAGLPLPTLLSQVLVAFTIEFDNEFERQMPHRTTTSKAAAGLRGPWLVSMAMWSNFMQFVDDEGVTVGELQKLARIAKLPLAGMERWGYIVVESKTLKRDWVVRPTAAGRRAREVWRPLSGVIEKRWEARFGKDEIGRLRESLSALVSRLNVELPDYLPVLGYGLSAEKLQTAPLSDRENVPHLQLPALLSKVLFAFTIDFEHAWELSLAISANVIRIIGEAGVRLQDLPRLAGVSKETIKTAVGFLEKRGYIVVRPDAAARSKLVRLSSKGQAAQDAYRQRLGDIEERWLARFGKDETGKLRKSLERLVGEPTAQSSPLFLGLEPYADGWRASVPKPHTLPHYPVVLHRGGYPDGS